MTAPDGLPAGQTPDPGAPPRPRIPVGVAWELPPEQAEDEAPTPEDFRSDARPAVELTANLAASAPLPRLIQPVPSVLINGVKVASGPSLSGAQPGQIVVDGFTVKWGREELLEQAGIGTGSLQLFDTTKTWATLTSLVGQLVQLTWTVPPWPNGSSWPTTICFFRGRITQVQVAPKTVRMPDGTTVRGSLVTLGLSSVVNDLANITPTVDWPEETLGARRDRILAATGGRLTDLTVRDYWTTPHVAPVAAANQVSLWDHIVNFYDSTGVDRLAYNPNSNRMDYMVRRDYYSIRGVAGLWWNSTSEPGPPPRAAQGAYMRTYPLSVAGGAVATPLYQDAGLLEYDPDNGLVRGPQQRLTRIVYTNPDGGVANYPQRTVTLPITGRDEIAEGVRQANLDSQVSWNSYADVGASDLQAFVSNEGSAWKLEELRLRAPGFENEYAIRQWLSGMEVQSATFLQASWLPQYRIRPMVAFIGGTIGFRDGVWDLTAHVAAVSTTLPQHAITFEEIDDGSATYEIQWWDSDNQHGMHRSLTFDDLGFCSTGLGVSIIPPDQGYDV